MKETKLGLVNALEMILDDTDWTALQKECSSEFPLEKIINVKGAIKTAIERAKEI